MSITMNVGPWVRTRMADVTAGSGVMTAWHIREFVKALDEAEIPDDTEVTAHKAFDTQRFYRLVAVEKEVKE